jgi:hypothetical protein
LAPHDSQAIINLTNEVRGYREDVKVLTTKLFGDPDEESAKGRLPMLEASQRDHGTRIGRLEKVRMRAEGAGWVLALIFGGVELLYHLIGIQRGH